MKQYVQRRIEAGITLKVIRSQSKEIKQEIWPSSQQELRELRYTPQKQIFPMTVYMYDKKVTVIGTKQEKFGMIIESADLYVTMKNLFDIVWEVSKVIKPL